MKGTPVDQLVYEYMFPKPRHTDPQNFQMLLQSHLIPEIRQEVHSFYGHLDTQEAKYPGLDYSNRTHRIRLSRWPWHRRLFRAFDGLRLTSSEIANLTKWEGTKWAKDRFERDSGIVIRDTAPEEVGEWIEPEDRTASLSARVGRRMPEEEGRQDAADEDMDEEESDGELESIGIALNERLRERAARREAGDTSEPLDEEWEQWLKNAIDSGALPFLTDHLLQQSDSSAAPETGRAVLIPQALFPPRMLSAARANQWDEVPEFLHEMLRRTLQTEASTSTSEASTPEPSSGRTLRDFLSTSSWRRTYSGLRLPDATATGSSGNLRYHRTAEPRA
ncbi:hypothetical protein BX600DRAFT_430325 [Xylariales sp. PMI_506]|nr:hypothetical protein BX600DRAFT_430325 [Xylariales sp. PMI_506]